MFNTTAQCKVRMCCKCRRRTEFFCSNCKLDLCRPCKQKHLNHLGTIDHTVIVYKDTFSGKLTPEMCLEHHNMVYKKYCKTCKIVLCYQCKGHKKQSSQGIRTAYKHHKDTIDRIRSEALLYRRSLFREIHMDVKTCPKEIEKIHPEICKKAQRLNHFIHNAMRAKIYKSKRALIFSIQKQCSTIKQCIVSMQEYEHTYEQSAMKPVGFILLWKDQNLQKIFQQLNYVHHVRLFMTDSINRIDVVKTLTDINIFEKDKRQVRSEQFLKSMPSLISHKIFSVPRIKGCDHISCVTSNMVWISNGGNIVLANTSGATLHHISDSGGYFTGNHTVNAEQELIYVDINYNVKKISKDMKTITTLLKPLDLTWTPQCVHFSVSTGDLLVGLWCGMWCEPGNILQGKINRYDRTGQLTQTIEYHDTGERLYYGPSYITENINGDVVVSDWKLRVVVTERGGKHRFSYAGDPLGSLMLPLGICTDALSNILMCASNTNTVMMLDKDGQFLSHFMMIPLTVMSPVCLCYDIKTHRLWVGSIGEKYKVIVTRHITRQVDKTGRVFNVFMEK